MTTSFEVSFFVEDINYVHRVTAFSSDHDRDYTGAVASELVSTKNLEKAFSIEFSYFYKYCFSTDYIFPNNIICAQ